MLAKRAQKKKAQKKKEKEKLPVVISPEVLSRFDDPGSDLPTFRDPSVSLTVRVFERESELKEAFKSEFAFQIGELSVCSESDCAFRYVSDGSRDPVVRMLVHHYLHLIRDSEDRVVLGALNRVSEILDPPKERVTSGQLEEGLLSREEKKLLRLTKRELRDL